jgi:hypothetical protein
VNHIEKYRKRQYMEQACLYFWAYTRKNSAIALGATPVGSAITHPIERSRQKKGEKLKLMIKNKLVDKWFRRNRLHFINKELWLHYRQNKDRLLPSGTIYES